MAEVLSLATKADFDKCLADAGDKLVVIDFTATWCPPCQMIKPKYKALNEELAGAVVMTACDVDDNAETSEACGITCMPTFQLYKGGVKIDELQGANYDALVEKINANK